MLRDNLEGWGWEVDGRGVQEGGATYVYLHLTLKDELPRSVGAQYTTGEEWKNTSRKKEGPETK